MESKNVEVKKSPWTFPAVLKQILKNQVVIMEKLNVYDISPIDLRQLMTKCCEDSNIMLKRLNE